MADTTPYVRAYSFTNYQADGPDKPLPGNRLDIELDNIADRSKTLTDLVNSGFKVDANLEDIVTVADEIDKVVFVADNIQDVRDAAEVAPYVQTAIALFLGAFPEDPSTGTNGDPLTIGATYYNTVVSQSFVWTGSGWTPIAQVSIGGVLQGSLVVSGGLTTFNIGDYVSVTVALNGQVLRPGIDFTAISPSITIPGAVDDDEVTWFGILKGSITDAAAFVRQSIVTTTATRYSQNSAGQPLNLTPSNHILFGASPFAVLTYGVDYTADAGDLVLLFTPDAGELYHVFSMPRFTNTEAQVLLAEIEGRVAADAGRAEAAAAVAVTTAIAADSFAAAAAAPKPAPQNRIGAIVEGQLQEWIADPAGTALGGGWKAAEGTTARAFGGDLSAAHGTGAPVEYGDRLWPSDASTGYFNLYGATKYRTASYDRVQLGLNSSPVDDPRPVFAVQKFTSAARDTDPSAWDQAGYFGLVKKTGGAFGAALTGFARSDGGDGDMIGVHARAARYTANGRGYGLWAYFAGHVESTQPGHAAEVNGFTTYDPGYGSTHQLVRLVMADSSSNLNRFGTALSIGPATLGGSNNGFHTGVRFEAGSIIRTTGDDGEVMRIDAPILGDGSIGGFRFAKGSAGHLGVFKYALRTDEATFANSEAIRLGNGQRLSWFNGGVRVGSLTGGTTALSLTGVMLNVVNPVSGTVLQAAGVKVIGTPLAALPPAATDLASALTLINAMRVGLTNSPTTHGLFGA